MEKPLLEVDLTNEDHLMELITNHEVYGGALVLLIKDMIDDLKCCVCTYGYVPYNFHFEGEDFDILASHSK